MTLDLHRFETLTFDCYGTLIDWEAGILTALSRLTAPGDLTVRREDPDALLEAFGRHEAAAEAGPYVTYREVLARVAAAIGAELGVHPGPGEVAAFADSVGDWPPFADTADALRRLARRYRLAVITNCDDDLFERSRQALGIDFDVVVTAQQAHSYKPALRSFEMAFERLGTPRERILHVAQSLYHDHVPARRLGLATVWVDRRAGRAGPGATPAAEATPDLVLPDMRTLADRADARAG